MAAGAAGAAARAALSAVPAARAALSAVPDGKRTSRKLTARPRRIVNQRAGSIAQLAWTVIVTLLALALLALVLRIATNRPRVVVSAVNVVPNAIRRFVNPFGDTPIYYQPPRDLNPTTKKKATI